MAAANFLTLSWLIRSRLGPTSTLAPGWAALDLVGVARGVVVRWAAAACCCLCVRRRQRLVLYHLRGGEDYGGALAATKPVSHE